MMPIPAAAEVRFVCEHMRQSSRDEMFLASPHEDPLVLANVLNTRPGISWVEYHEGLPAAIIGAWPMHPGVWGLYGLGTDHYAAVLKKVTRHGLQVMLPAIWATGAHRLQALSPATHEENHRWMLRLGAAEEATLRHYGKNGEDVKVFAWLKEAS